MRPMPIGAANWWERADWDTLRLWLVMLGIGLQPISTATGNIGFGIAVAGAALR
jgi:hypothetical protein